MVPSQGGRAQLRGRLIVCRSGCLQLWWELPALAPGARCQSGRSVGSGAPKTVQWTATRLHARNVTSGQECWSRGRIVSALLAGAQGGCRPSAEPPNPVGITMDPAVGDSKSGGGSPSLVTSGNASSWRAPRRRCCRPDRADPAPAPPALSGSASRSPPHGPGGLKGCASQPDCCAGCAALRISEGAAP